MRRLLLVFGLACGLLSEEERAALAQPAPPRDQTYPFAIPPQRLSSAVEAFAVATGIQVIYDRPVGGELRSPGMQGQSTAAQGLAQILAGSGLRAQFTDARDVVLEPINAMPAAAPALPPEIAKGPSLSLDTLEVQAPTTVEIVSSGFDRQFYRGQIESRVHQALAQNPATAKGPYETILTLWIAPSGRLARAVIARSSGNTDRDRAIVQTLVNFQLDGPAPTDMPQPISVGVHVKSGGD
jgi:TonB family protein